MATPFDRALAAIDAAHAEDPKTVLIDNQSIPYELHYANKMTAYLSKRAPTPSPALSLAIRAQHLRRWEIPRATYPMTRPGYHGWRNALKKRQAQLARDMCIEAGLEAEVAERVAALVRKEGLAAGDEEVQVLEDVACLVFLDDQFAEFGEGMEEEKVVAIVRKTWGKMTEGGRALALGIPMEGRARELVEKALAG